jgi:hypothetical protein
VPAIFSEVDMAFNSSDFQHPNIPTDAEANSATTSPRKPRQRFPQLENDFGEDAEERDIVHLSDL